MAFREERFEQLVSASIEDVWWALTTPEGLAAWFGVECEIDLRVGGARRVAWGEVAIDGVIDAVDPHRRIRVAYLADGVEMGAEEWLLDTDDGGTVRLTLINSMSDEGIDDWEGYFGDMRRGWRLFMASLAHAVGAADTRTREALMRYLPAPGDRQVLWDELEPAVQRASTGLEPEVIDEPHSRLYVSGNRTLLVDIEGSGPGQVVYAQVAGHPSLQDGWAQATIDDLAAALAG